MRKFLKFSPSQKPLEADIGNITDSDLYEYAFPSNEITFEVVKIVSVMVVFIAHIFFIQQIKINVIGFQEDYDCLVNEADADAYIDSKPSTSIETEHSTRKSQRTPKKKLIIEYGSIPERRKGHAKNRLEKSHTSRDRTSITRRPNEPMHVSQLSSIEQLIKTEKSSPKKEQSIKNHSKKKRIRIRKPSFATRTATQAMEVRPGHKLRYDGIDHFPCLDEKDSAATRCKMEGCKLKSHYYCIKCKVHLCLKRNMNCFKTFHVLSS